MSTNFPTSLDTLTNPTASDTQDSVTVPHATQHANVNDAIEALQAKVGIDGSAVATSLDYKVANKQPLDTQLTDIAALATTDGGFIVGNGTTFVLETGTTARASMGVAIGSDVQAYDADTAKLDVAQSWTAEQTFKELKDTVHTISDGAAFEIDPGNGSVQIVTLGANRTPAATNFAAGQTVLLGVDDGTAYAITWTTVAPTWVKPGGSASAPTLATSGYTWILLWKVGSTIYAAEVGKP